MESCAREIIQLRQKSFPSVQHNTSHSHSRDSETSVKIYKHTVVIAKI